MFYLQFCIQLFSAKVEFDWKCKSCACAENDESIAAQTSDYNVLHLYVD